MKSYQTVKKELGTKGVLKFPVLMRHTSQSSAYKGLVVLFNGLTTGMIVVAPIDAINTNRYNVGDYKVGWVDAYDQAWEIIPQDQQIILENTR